VAAHKRSVPAVYYLGPEGTFSHILARKRFGKRAELAASATIEGIFDGVASTPGSLGLVPVENSSGGTVYDSVDMLIRNAGRVFIHEELALDVRIALLGKDPKNIRTIFSHFVQLKHHAEWLKARYPQAKLKAVVSTAVAAQNAAADAKSAALASPGAAEFYGLEVLERPKVGQEVNVTHFYVISSEPPKASAPEPSRTALVAALPNICGSLHQFLGPFARQKVSLTRIVSRPVPGQPQTYVFFVEIEGGPDTLPVARALRRAGELAETLRSLGTFPVGARFKS
jgi:chorismate mutase/prephenate dehydratase